MYKEIIYVRIDEDIKNELEALAVKEDRSLNNFVVYILKKYLEEQENKEKKDN